ncbi:uncharacterized protein Z519_09259 [Cladophialophora bantiana CBS 173.52]|uniref:FAD linked oxidase N-terminal domain-containing protein n=1 Tax=Cladophialophora bantiana (strain ATCC 10958 / CBS 173.52 / CDC B-1940 / NIH 8579) TaxID=1442370 RepID=A0A0D2HG97_CLAB1|nr:uncharacterized protein Z519_09259 [Cladophialophora bantiana CBS 173.52]KIW89830.1 hypothetical protein Z519_09259 [Cladophialophora bantiana CBS 173.52]
MLPMFTIIQEAKARKLKVTVKCTGHSYADHSTAFQGISLDIRRMKNVALDLKSKQVAIDFGGQSGDVYKTLIKDKHTGNGSIINGGRCPLVGVSSSSWAVVLVRLQKASELAVTL